MSENKYQFSWDLIGNLSVGRPNLGTKTDVEVYRLMQFTFRDVIARHYGADAADTLFYEAGKLAGKAFYENRIRHTDDLNDFVSQLQQRLKDSGIGILRVEKADMKAGELTLTVSEDLDCSGLPELSFEICKYDEGFICALLEAFTGTSFFVKEIDCWCTGDRTCRFQATALL